MKKSQIFVGIFVVLLIVLIGSLIFRGCSALLLNHLYDDLKNRDWRIDLCNGYYIQKLNGSEIFLIKDGWSENSNIVTSNCVTAYCYQDQDSNLFFGKGIILGEPTKDLRFVGVLSTEDSFLDARCINLEELDTAIDYNGFHSSIKNRPECWINPGNKTRDGSLS